MESSLSCFRTWDVLVSPYSLRLSAPNEGEFFKFFDDDFLGKLKDMAKSVNILIGIKGKEHYEVHPPNYNYGDFGMSINYSSLVCPKNLVFPSNGLTLTRSMLQVLDRMVESERPMALIHIPTQKQVAINSGFVELLDTPPDVATSRCVKIGWNPEDLNSCNTLIEQRRKFELQYRTALNPRVYGVATGEIELVCNEYRLNTNLDFTPQEFPDQMKQLQEFDW
jgi:hypothetical protein